MNRIYILILFFSIIFFSDAYADRQAKIINKGETVLPKVFGKHPVYKLKIHGQSNKFQLFFNGVEIYKDYTTTTSNITYPINDVVTNGENKLTIKLIASKGMNYHFRDDAFLKVSLIVENDQGEEMVLSTLSYIQKDEQPFSKSTPEGKYLIDEKLKKSNEGDLKVGKVSTKSFSMFQTVKVNGLYVSQKLTFPAPFPRWKFLDSKDILDKPFDSLTMEEYMKLKESQKIKGLYDAYRKVYTALKNKDVDEALKFFKERFEEFDIAWYRPKGYNRNKLLEALKAKVKNSDWELEEFDEKNIFFLVDDGNKLAHAELIVFKKKNKSLYSSYYMKFRWDGKDWILTR